MTERQLRYAVATDGPIVLWQARCVDALGAEPTVTIERWLVAALAADARETAAGIRALEPTAVPNALHGLPPEELLVGTDATPPAASGATVDVLVDLSTVGLDLPVPWASEVWRFGYGRALSTDPARSALIEYARGSGSTRVALVSRPSGEIVRDGLLQTVSWWTGMPLDRLLLDTADWPALVARARAEPGGQTDRVPSSVPRHPNRTTASGGIRSPRRRGVTARTGSGSRCSKSRPSAGGCAAGSTSSPDMWTGTSGSSTPESNGCWPASRACQSPGCPFGPAASPRTRSASSATGSSTSCSRISTNAKGEARSLISRWIRTGVVSEPTIVLDPGVHASYPYLIEHDGRVFMLPRRRQPASSSSYEAVDFPLGWRPIATMLPGVAAVDASVIEHAGRWWMFATRADRGGEPEPVHMACVRTDGSMDPSRREPGQDRCTLGTPGRDAVRPRGPALPAEPGQFDSLRRPHRPEPGRCR